LAVRAYFIYIWWFLAQIFLLVILLNFVIALIGQFYEDVMNRRVMHTYMMKHNMNDQHYIYEEFLAKLGWKEDKTFDFIILIDGNEEEDDSIWKGLT
jgi:hypothetical protein